MGGTTKFVVDFAGDALPDFEQIRDKGERKALYNVVDKLMSLGDKLPPPHAKKLQGETDLYELRPRGGNSPVRPIYIRTSERFVILAIAKNKDDFERAKRDARDRFAHYQG